MITYPVRVLPMDRTLSVAAGTSLLQALQQAGLHTDAPCGGQGTCGKCKVLVEGAEVLACRTTVERPITVILPQVADCSILTEGLSVQTQPDTLHDYILAFDIGTTTVVCYLLNGHTGARLAQESCLNPQTQYGADVITRLQYALQHPDHALQRALLEAMSQLTEAVAKQTHIRPDQITLACVVGNTAMHHLLLGIDPKPLTTPPYMPKVSDAVEIPAKEYLPISENGILRILPNIAGFVGADTVGCLVATRFDKLDKLTLLIDIGTNGEMVLGDKNGYLACSTAAGPAFEGAKISCGMRGVEGAVDHIQASGDSLRYHTIGEANPVGLCGSGLLDLVAVLLDKEEILESGRMPCKQYRLEDTPVVLTQQDVREVQLAKGAIAAGITLMCEQLGKNINQIDAVLLAGAFGNYLDPKSACRIGLLPACLESKIRPIGNAAGVGAMLCAVSQAEFEYSQQLAQKAQFLELASLPQFQENYIECLNFPE